MLHILYPSMTPIFRSACSPRQWLELYAKAKQPSHFMQLVKEIGAFDMFGGLLTLCGLWFNEAMHVLNSKKTLEVGPRSWSYPGGAWNRLHARPSCLALHTSTFARSPGSPLCCLARAAEPLTARLPSHCSCRLWC